MVDISANGHRVRLTFPSAEALPNPGAYTVTVRACVNLAIGTLRACHELASNGSNTYPDLIVYALSPRVVE